MSDDLIEFVDAEFFVPDATSPADEQKIFSALDHIAGIAEARMAHGRVDVHYDPTAITKAEITKRIEDAGFRISDVQVAASSPVTDSNSPI